MICPEEESQKMDRPESIASSCLVEQYLEGMEPQDNERASSPACSIAPTVSDQSQEEPPSFHLKYEDLRKMFIKVQDENLKLRKENLDQREKDWAEKQDLRNKNLKLRRKFLVKNVKQTNLDWREQNLHLQKENLDLREQNLYQRVKDLDLREKDLAEKLDLSKTNVGLKEQNLDLREENLDLREQNLEQRVKDLELREENPKQRKKMNLKEKILAEIQNRLQKAWKEKPSKHTCQEKTPAGCVSEGDVPPGDHRYKETKVYSSDED